MTIIRSIVRLATPRCLAARGEFKHIHRIESRLDEHGSEHLISLFLPESKASGERKSFQMLECHSPCSGVPRTWRSSVIMQSSGFITSVYLGAGDACSVLPDSCGIASVIPEAASSDPFICPGGSEHAYAEHGQYHHDSSIHRFRPPRQHAETECHARKSR